MGYNISQNQKLTFLKGQFSHQWKYLIHTIMQCLSPKSTGFNEFSSNISTALVCLATNRTYNFSKMIIDCMVKNINNKTSKFLMDPRVKAQAHQLTEPHHTPFPEAETSHPTTSSIPLPSIPTAPISPYEPASPVRDVSEGEACPTESGFIADQDRASIAKSSTLPHVSAPRVTSPAADEGTTVLAGGIDDPTGSGSIPTAGPPATIISTGSEVGRHIPAGRFNRRAPFPAGRSVPTGWTIFQTNKYFDNVFWLGIYDHMSMNEGRWGSAVKSSAGCSWRYKRPYMQWGPRTIVDLINLHGFTFNDPQGRLKSVHPHVIEGRNKPKWRLTVATQNWMVFTFHVLFWNEKWLFQGGTALGKDVSNPFTAVMVCQKPLGYFSSPMIHVPALVIHPPGYAAPSPPLNLGVRIVPEKMVFIVERIGKYERTLEPGMHFLIPSVDKIAYVHSLKSTPFISLTNLLSPMIMSPSSLMLPFLFRRVFNPMLSSYAIENPIVEIIQFAKTTLQSEIGKVTLDQTFNERVKLNEKITVSYSKQKAWATDGIGLSIGPERLN
nr:hypothetical protein [Tanacetum cinerariifolium]